MKRFIIILMFWVLLINPVQSGSRYNNNLRALPFIQMMITMMNFMDIFMGGNKRYYPGMNSWGAFPYSPMSSMSSLPGSNFGNFPMSPIINGASILNKSSFLPEGFKSENNSTDSHTPYGRESGNDNLDSLSHNNLNGIWQALSGDVIAIYHNNHFIWSDGNSRNLSGRLIIRGKQFFAYIPAKNTTLQFQFYQEPGQFVVRDKNGRIYTFKRIY